MRVYNDIPEFQPKGKAIVTSGTFDGVHIGHQKILKTLQEIASQTGGETVLITFWPHPRLVLDPIDDKIKLLTLFEEKARVLARYGLDHLVKIPFTREFSELSSTEFIEKILVDGLGTETLVIGYDHKFGKNREGSFESLKANSAQWGFSIKEIPRQDIEKVGVSSSRIRQALAAGDIHISNKYLGYEYCLNGEVVPGDKLGRKLGYPTANIHIASDLKLIPAGGIYAIRVIHDGQNYDGMLNIGTRPTVGGSKRTIEAHIFDFDKDIYGDEIRIQLVKRIRFEQKFASLDLLKAQLTEDKKMAQKILS